MLDYEIATRILKTPPSESVFQDVMLCRCLVLEAYGYCRNRGRHEFRPIAYYKDFMEDFIGHPIDEMTVIAALRMNGLQPTRSLSDKSVLLVKTPPLYDFEQVREQWKHRQAAEEKDFNIRWTEFQRTKK